MLWFSFSQVLDEKAATSVSLRPSFLGFCVRSLCRLLGEHHLMQITNHKADMMHIGQGRTTKQLSEFLAASVDGDRKLLIDKEDEIIFGLWVVLILCIFFKGVLTGFKPITKIRTGEQATQQIGLRGQ